MACIAALALAGAAQAAEGAGRPVPQRMEDVGGFLEGRWGNATSSWEDQTEDGLFAPCRKGHSRADSAYSFSGDSAHLQVESYGPQNAPTKEEPVVSSVVLGPLVDPAEVEGYETAAMIAPISFDSFWGFLMIIDEDRIRLIGPNAIGYGLIEYHLLRCGDR